MKTKKFKFRRLLPFTVLEMMMAMTLLAIVMFVLISIMDQSQKIVTSGISKINVFEDARSVLDLIENDFACVEFNPGAWGTSPDDADESIRIPSSSEITLYTYRSDVITQLCKVSYKFSGSLLKEEKRVWDQSLNNGEGDWSGIETRNLLINVGNFRVKKMNDDNERTVYDKKYSHKYMIEIALLDEETRRLGYSGTTTAFEQENQEQSVDQSRIQQALGPNGSKVYQARLKRFTRVVSLDLESK